MRDLIEAMNRLMLAWFGVAIPEAAFPYIIIASVVVPAIIPIWLWLRRSVGDIRAVSDEMQAATALISGEVTTRLATVSNQLEASLARRLDDIHAAVKLTHEVTARSLQPDIEVVEEPADQRPSRATRKDFASQASNAVLQKWTEGRTLTVASDDPNCYSFVGRNPSGTKIELYLTTPYRRSIGSDGRLPFALDVWVDGRKHLNFEWDFDGNYALRGFKRGEWFEDIVGWNFIGVQAETVRAA